jgi:hypothetical protein
MIELMDLVVCPGATRIYPWPMMLKEVDASGYSRDIHLHCVVLHWAKHPLWLSLDAHLSWPGIPQSE